MQNLKPDLQGEEASVIQSILDASRQISYFIRHSPIYEVDSKNKFGDQQLHQDIKCDQIIEEHLKKNPTVKGFASEERPHLEITGQGQGFYVTFDPLDGSSIIDTNFSIGSIFSIWRTTEKKLIGQKVGSQVNALLVVYGPRTTAVLYNNQQQRVHEFTLMEDHWVITHDNITIHGPCKIFSPGNLRCANDIPEYFEIIQGWMKRGLTLRYTGGLILDVIQIFIKKQGIFCNIGSVNHKCKLRVLYELAAVGFLIQKAGGKSITVGKQSIMDYEIKSFDDRLPIAVGTPEQVDKIAHLF